MPSDFESDLPTRGYVFADDATWPSAIAALPRDKRGYPITFTTYIDSAGEPDFRILDAGRRGQCYTDRLCAVCGGKLGYWIVFIGGPRCEQTRMFLDPAMHPDCADFSFAICPHLSNARAKYNDRAIDPSIHLTEYYSTRPNEFKRFRTRSYEVVEFNHDVMIKSAPFVEVKTVKFTRG